MRVDLSDARPLRFADGTPVRAASAIVSVGSGWLVAQDDSTLACLLRDDRDDLAEPLRLLPQVGGHDHFAEHLGTKHLKPDLESAVELDGEVLLLGSGSTPARMRSVLVRPGGDAEASVTDLTLLYAAVARVLGVAADTMNLEGACVVGGALRWFQRGLPSAGVPTASVDVDLSLLLAVARGEAVASEVRPRNVRTYDLGEVGGVGLAVTDAVSLGDGRVLVSAAAEDSPNTYDDGPVVGSALALLDGDAVIAMAPVPLLDDAVAKVEGLALLDWSGPGGRLLATVDADDPEIPSTLLTLEVSD